MDVEKTIQFILAHEAQHEVEIQQLRQMVRGLAKNQAQLQQTVGGLQQTVRGFLRTQQQTINGVVAVLVDSARQIVGLTRENRAFRRDLKALTKLVDKVVRHNGRGRK